MRLDDKIFQLAQAEQPAVVMRARSGNFCGRGSASRAHGLGIRRATEALQPGESAEGLQSTGAVSSRSEREGCGPPPRCRHDRAGAEGPGSTLSASEGASGRDHADPSRAAKPSKRGVQIREPKKFLNFVAKTRPREEFAFFFWAGGVGALFIVACNY